MRDNLIIQRINRIKEIMAVGEDPKNIQNLIIKRDSAATYGEDGVDLTLIRWMLSLTPAQRLEALQRYIQSVEQLSK